MATAGEGHIGHDGYWRLSEENRAKIKDHLAKHQIALDDTYCIDWAGDEWQVTVYQLAPDGKNYLVVDDDLATSIIAIPGIDAGF